MSETVATPSAAYDHAARKWALPRALMGGTAVMRDAGTTWLPQEPAESEAAYRNRRDRSVLFNGYRKTVRDMAGKVFAKPVQLGDDVPERLVSHAENIDLAGRHLSNFAHAVFTDALQTGVSYILTEMPPAREGTTRRDDIETGRRPYLCHIKAENLIGWKSDNIAGREVLTQVRVYETTCEDDPEDEFAEITVAQVRVFDRTPEGVLWRVFRKAESGKKTDWIEHDSGVTSLAEITLTPVYANQTGFMTGTPPLEDLAYVNLAHWQSSSDQRNILHVARVPILFARSMDDSQPALTVGANAYVWMQGDHADLKYVEHTGQAIDSGRDDLKDLEFQMQTMGLELLIPKPGNDTATGEAIDQAKMNAPLAMMADNLKDALEQSFAWMAEYEGLGRDAGGSLTVNTDFGVTMRDASDIDALLKAVNAGQISRETFWKEMKRRGVLMDDFEPEEEVERLENEGPALGMVGRDEGLPFAAE